MTGACDYFNRRRFLKASGAALACGLARFSSAASIESGSLIDTHVYIGNWPLRRLSAEMPAALVAQLRRAKVTQAWAGNFDGVFHKDVHGANSRLVKMCREAGNGLLMPIGTVNPMLPDWEEDLRRCHESFKMPGIRLHPNYHGYALDEPRFIRLVELAATRGLFVQIVAQLDNVGKRNLTPRILRVDLAPLSKIAHQIGHVRLLIAGTVLKDVDSLDHLLKKSKTYFDCAQAVEAEPFRKLVNRVSAERVVYGSAAPLKNITPIEHLRNDLAVPQVRAVSSGNAQRLMH
jgi:predicted TIM-barrel fold metal-dependent hydrolase